ncbi:hypothetical protein T492DRAFT_850453 [Pavlovales sp. CCMP2436]|nr:hypothetical protein T492DRAFT_850453 [Pavlovales sp. CCMP2436]
MQKSEGGHYGVLPSHALSLKGKLELLKVKGLQEVLQSLGLSKQGRKLELISRILLACADESSVRARTVDGLVGQLLGWSSAGGGGAASAAAAHPVATAGSATSTAPRGRVRCLCIDASAAMQRDLVSCRECGCLQHAVCVELRVGDKTHTCELCRLRDVDPTVEPVGESARLSLLFPHCQSPMMTSSRRMAGTLRLSQAELALLSCPDHQIRLYVLDVRPQVNYHRWPVGLVVGVNGVDVDLRLPPAAWDGVTNRYKTRVVDEVGILSAQREVRRALK